MKALYITMHNCFSKSGGGGMASHAYLHAFSDIFRGNIDLICADSIKHDKTNIDNEFSLSEIYYVPKRSKLNKYLSVFTGQLNRYYAFSKTHLKKYNRDYDFVIFDHSSIGGEMIDYARELGLKTITIHHNYEKEYFSDNTHGLKKLFFLKHVVTCERKSYLKSDFNLFLTKQDMDTFRKVYGINNAFNTVIGAFEFSNQEKKVLLNTSIKSNLTFAITGSLCNYQTVDAIKYFFNCLYKYIPETSQIIVAGRNPTPEVHRLCSVHENVILIPSPQNMDFVLANADIYICATKIGGGLKLRVMDGLRNGLPVITHICSVRGFDDFKDKNYFFEYSNAEEFRQAILMTIDNYNSGCYTKIQIQEDYEKIFSYSSGLKRMRKIIGIS